VLLTVFLKTRMREDREVERAWRALARCMAEEHDTEEHDTEGDERRRASAAAGATFGTGGWASLVRVRLTTRARSPTSSAERFVSFASSGLKPA
jgi:hypothetical protein